MDKDIEYIDTRSKMESAILKYYECAIAIDMDEIYIIEDIKDAVFNGTNEKIILCDE